MSTTNEWKKVLHSCENVQNYTEFCPVCGKDDVDVRSTDFGETHAYRTFKCSSCESEWEISYEVMPIEMVVSADNSIK